MTGLTGDSDGLPVDSSQPQNLFLRSCFVEINNSCGFYTLSDPGIFLSSGECGAPLPPQIQRRSQAGATFGNTLGTATGAVGVFTYHLLNNKCRDYNAVLAVMFSVPFDYNLYANWCGAGIFYRGTPCDHSLFDLMYYGSEAGFVRAEGGAGTRTYAGEVVAVSVSVTGSSRAVLRVNIKDLAGGAGKEGVGGAAEGLASSVHPL